MGMETELKPSADQFVSLTTEPPFRSQNFGSQMYFLEKPFNLRKSACKQFTQKQSHRILRLGAFLLIL